MQYLGKFKGCAYAKFDYDPYKTYWVYFVLKVTPSRLGKSATVSRDSKVTIQPFGTFQKLSLYV